MNIIYIRNDMPGRACFKIVGPQVQAAYNPSTWKTEARGSLGVPGQ